jgi:ubiquinone/menaquinone biosynthesis C-methylase UbiE
MDNSHKLILLPRHIYRGVNEDDPIRYYFWPVFGRMYRKRVEMALAECTGGQCVLEVGFGTGLAFINLARIYKEIHGVDLTANISEVKSVFDNLHIPTHLKQGDILSLPYEDGYFETVLLISILEHLKPETLAPAFLELRRVLKPGGQVVYGTPVERPFMVFMFRLLGHDIRREHFSTEKQIESAARSTFNNGWIKDMKGVPALLGAVYQIGHFIK